MFGYVRARWDTIPEEGAAAYRAVYCGLCREMGRKYGHFARLFLNYDLALLAMLLLPEGERLCLGCRACPRHPFRARSFCESRPWLETAAGESVILTYWKLRDAAADEAFLPSLGAKALCALLKPAYRKARADRPEFDAAASELLGQLRELEEEGCPSIDRTADCFARILQSAAPKSGDAVRDRALAELLYHMGRWVYLIDGVDDLEEDRRAGRYNPVAARFQDWSEEDRLYLRQLTEHSLARMGAAFELLPPNACAPAVENVIYSGLPAVEELVFSGRWKQAQKTTHRRRGL